MWFKKSPVFKKKGGGGGEKFKAAGVSSDGGDLVKINGIIKAMEWNTGFD